MVKRGLVDIYLVHDRKTCTYRDNIIRAKNQLRAMEKAKDENELHGEMETNRGTCAPRMLALWAI